ARREHHAPDQLHVVVLQRVHCGHVALRDHQHVRRGLRIDVSEGEGVPVLAHHLRRYVPGYDPAEDALRTRHDPSLIDHPIRTAPLPPPSPLLRPSLHPTRYGFAPPRAPSCAPQREEGIRPMLSEIEQRVLTLLRNDPEPMVPLARIHAALVAELGPRIGTYAQLHDRLRRRPDLFLLLDPLPLPWSADTWSGDVQDEYRNALREAGIDTGPRVALAAPDVELPPPPPAAHPAARGLCPPQGSLRPPLARAPPHPQPQARGRQAPGAGGGAWHPPGIARPPVVLRRRRPRAPGRGRRGARAGRGDPSRPGGPRRAAPRPDAGRAGARPTPDRPPLTCRRRVGNRSAVPSG